MDKLWVIFRIAGCLLVAGEFAHAENFSAWQAAHFTPTEISDASIGTAMADPDGDTFSNLLEYAFVLNP